VTRPALRTLASLAAGLASAILINAIAAVVLRWPDVFWSLAWEWGLAARLYLATAVGAYVAARIARRAPVLHAAIAAVPSLVMSYDWWRSENALWLVALIAISGALGVISGAAMAGRAHTLTPSG
jgi:hypothetical protein